MIPYLHDEESGFWEGRVADVVDTRGSGKLETKEKNIPNAPGFYVKVRIYKYHTDDVTKLRNEQLPWIEVAGTVLGSGRSGSGATPNIVPGDHVYGRWVNGRPVVDCVKLCDPEKPLPRSQPTNGLAPLSTYIDGPVASFSIPANQPFPDNAAWRTYTFSVADEQKGDFKSFPKLPIPCPNEKANGSAIASKISGTIQKIEGYQRTVRKYESVALNYINDKEQLAQEWIQKQSIWLTGKIDWLITEIQKRVTGAINGASAAAAKQVPINGRFAVREAQSIIVEAIICFFKNMIRNIASIIANVLRELVNRFVNVPLCALENFLKTLLANIVGMLTSALTGLAGALRSIVSSVAGFVNQVLGLVASVLKLFECDLNENCGEVKEWHILDAANTQNAKITLDIDSIINSAKGLASNFTNIVNPDTYGINASLINFSNIFSSLTCNTAPFPCGPPTVQFLGGGGSATTGNVIVSALGEILGVDIVAPGFNYSGVPTVSFIDACGKGYNANATAVMGTVPTVRLRAVGPTSDQSYFLVWKSKNAISAVTNFGSSELDGRLKVKPTATTRYTITVSDASGFTAQDSVTITPGVSTTEGGVGESDPLNLPLGIETDDLENFSVDLPIDSGVVAVIIEDPGFGYLPQEDGSLGGDGRTWSNSDETIVLHYNPIQGDGFGGTIGVDDGAGSELPTDPQLVPVIGPGSRPDIYTYDQPYFPGSVIDLAPGDVILTPGGSTTTTVIDVDGNDIATVLPGVLTLIDPNGSGGSTTAPFPSSEITLAITEGGLPSTDDGRYPVMLKICSVIVRNPGVNYSENDKIIVTPSNGAVLKPILGPFGTIAGVEVI